MIILLTNDDGIFSEGLNALLERFASGFVSRGRIVTVAPAFPSSGISSALTFNKPVQCNKLGEDKYELNGTPVDCVQWALKHLIKEKVSLVVSGINHGPNLGTDIVYSGTVGAALEAARLGVQSLAVSLVMTKTELSDFSSAADYAFSIAEQLIKNPLPFGVTLSANIPLGKINGVKSTRPGKRIYSDIIEERIDPFGRKYYWMAGDGTLSGIPEPGTDIEAVQQNYISISPLDSDMFASYTDMELWMRSLQDMKTV